MDVTGFSYQGLQTVATAAGPISVMVFTMSDASWTSLRLCLGAQPLVMSSVSGNASGGVTLSAITLAATVGGSPVSYSVSSPPAAQPLPSGSGTLTGVSTSVIGLAVHGAGIAEATIGQGHC